MKYCRTCKTRANEADTVCAKCGAPLASLGAAPGAGAGAANSSAEPMLSLQGQIGQLEAAQQRNTRLTRQFAALCGLVLLLLLAILYEAYSYAVLSYAVLRDVRIDQDPSSDSTIRVSFEVVKPGKVAFDRVSGGHRTEKLDVFAQPGPVKLDWTWPSDRETGVDFRVVFRAWLRTATKEQHFNVRNNSGSVDIVFLLDTTASMEPFIEGLRQKCIDFAALVRREGYDCHLGLIGFGDVEIREPMQVLDPTGDVQLFQTRVATLKRTNGGDQAESGVEALRRALQLQFRSGASVCFVHITDADCHHEQQIIPLSKELRERSIATYVVSSKQFKNLYYPLYETTDGFYAIEEADFGDILVKVARSITSRIGYR